MFVTKSPFLLVTTAFFANPPPQLSLPHKGHIKPAQGVSLHLRFAVPGGRQRRATRGGGSGGGGRGAGLPLQ
jgi:hypothetical protein